MKTLLGTKHQYGRQGWTTTANPTGGSGAQPM
jgi:hypothetical protein